MKRLSIIIPVYNQLAYTQKCLASLYATMDANQDEIIVSDDGSTDGTHEYLESQIPKIQWVRNTGRKGFGGNCNSGAAKASGRYLVFLNNDTEACPGWIEPCLKIFEEDPTAGIVGNKLLYPDGTIQHGGLKFGWMEEAGVDVPLHRFRWMPSDAPIANRKEEVHAITAACLFIPRKLFVFLKGFSDEYGMYFEDVDLNLRVRAAAKKIIYEPKSVVIHHERKSTDEMIGKKYLQESATVFYQKWGDRLSEILGKPKRPDKKSFGIKWDGILFQPSGYSSAMRRHVLSLNKMGVPIQIQPEKFRSDQIRELGEEEVFLLSHLTTQSVPQDICITSFLPTFQGDTYRQVRTSNDEFKYHIGYTMFETDRIPDQWVETCNQMDEIWVPSRFNQSTFTKAGVDPWRVQVMPLGVDGTLFNPNDVDQLPVADADTFVFLSNFEWSHRKGWDVLLKAYFQTFSRKDRVLLLLHVRQAGGTPIDAQLAAFLEREKLSLQHGPALAIHKTALPPIKMPSLYRSADAFILPTRGEGWGLPFMEAMAMGLPTIATQWGAHLDFMSPTNSYLISSELEEIPEDILGQPPLHRELYQGHRWANPSVQETGRLMREVYENREASRLRGAMGRESIIKNYDQSMVTRMVLDRLQEIDGKIHPERHRVTGQAMAGSEKTC